MTPDGWQRCRIGELLANDAPGYWGTPPSGLGDMAVLRSTNLRENEKLDFGNVAFRSFPEKKIVQKRLEPGDLLLERSGGGPKKPVGRIAYFQAEGRFSYSNFMQRLRPDGNRVRGEFLTYALSYLHASGVTLLMQQATTGIRNLNYKEYLAYEISVPPIPEQLKIAAVLSSVDDAIEKTQAVIDQVQVVKRGLMQELLTRGLPGRHTRFKQTEIGTIPQEWKLKKLSEVASVQTGLAKNAVNAGSLSVRYLRVANVQDGFLDLTEVKSVNVREDALSRYQLKPGDVLFTEGGDADKLGRGTVWNGEIELCLHQNHIFVARPLGSVRPMFLSLYRGSPRGKSYFLSCSKQTTNLASMNSTQLKNLPLPVPRLDEQDGIADRLGAVDSRLSYEEKCLSVLNRLKSALMSVLLNGELRVSPDGGVA